MGGKVISFTQLNEHVLNCQRAEAESEDVMEGGIKVKGMKYLLVLGLETQIN